MPRDIRDRLQKAIQEEADKDINRLRASRESAREAEKRFEPVRQAAEEIREALQSEPYLKFTINPDSVWVTLADRNLWFGNDIHSEGYEIVEITHSWIDGDPYEQRYTYETADDCIDAVIRLCAQYVRMARAISAGASEL